MVCVDSTVVLLRVMPGDVSDVSSVAFTCRAGPKTTAPRRARDCIARSYVLLQLCVPDWLSKVSAVTLAHSSISSTGTVCWAVRVLTVLAAVARETLAGVDLVRVVTVEILTGEGLARSMARLAASTRRRLAIWA